MTFTGQDYGCQLHHFLRPRCIDFFLNTGAQGIVGYIAIKLPYVVHKNGAHRLPTVSRLLITQLDQHAVCSHEYARALGICEKVFRSMYIQHP